MKGKFKTVEEVIKNGKTSDLNTNYLKAIIEGQNKEFEFTAFDEGFLCKEFKDLCFEKEDIIFDGMIWKPESGERYCCILSSSDWSRNTNHFIDKEMIHDNRTVKTKDEEEFYRKKLLRYLAELRWWYENDNHYEFIPGNENFYIFIDDKNIWIGSAILIKSKNAIYYSSIKKAQDCLNWLK